MSAVEKFVIVWLMLKPQDCANCFIGHCSWYFNNKCFSLYSSVSSMLAIACDLVLGLQSIIYNDWFKNILRIEEPCLACNALSRLCTINWYVTLNCNCSLNFNVNPIDRFHLKYHVGWMLMGKCSWAYGFEVVTNNMITFLVANHINP